MAPPHPVHAGNKTRLGADCTVWRLALAIHGGANPCNDPSTSADKQVLLTDGCQHGMHDGAGHFPQREAPAAMAEVIIGFLVG